MAEHPTERRLAAILAADVVGYSRLLGGDEAGTLARLRAVRQDVIDPLIAEHGGHVFKTTGDGLLAEFSSAVQALRCAIAIQERQRADAGTLQLRIGLHQGDVVIEGDDLLGDGVNIAARIEPLAEPGGICISARVREDAAGKISLEVDDLGEPELKNIATKIRVFRVRLAAPPPARQDDAIGKPSIAVLAFTNMSGDADQEYFSDGVAEDIITQLSRSSVLFVIARNSTFTYKGHAVDIRQVGRELGVRYVLEGSVRRGGDRVRITAQLIEAQSGNHVWAERYDRGLADIFAVQDEISDEVARAIEPAISHAERQRISRKPPDSLDAWEAYQRGLWLRARHNATDNARSRAFFEQAIRLDPAFIPPYVEMAHTYMSEGVFYGTRPLAEAAALALKAGETAVAIDPDDAAAHQAVGRALWPLGDPTAVFHNERALEIDPNHIKARVAKGVYLVFAGHGVEGRELLRAELRRNPRDEEAVISRSNIATSEYGDGHYAAAVDAAELTMAAHPGHPRAYLVLTASLGQLGRSDAARLALQRAVAVSPKSFQAFVSERPPYYSPELYQRILDGLRKAGWTP